MQLPCYTLQPDSGLLLWMWENQRISSQPGSSIVTIVGSGDVNTEQGIQHVPQCILGGDTGECSELDVST